MRHALFCAVFFSIFFAASFARAATFEVGGWVPYWQSESGIQDVLSHREQITTVHPFVYTVSSDGTIIDNGSIEAEPWKSFIANAKGQKIRVIPTILWTDGGAMYALMSATSSRIALENRIAALVFENNFDGIDIDFEGKYAATRNYFSTFLEGLYMRMGPKWVYCTIEAVSAANDLSRVNKYCDRVQVMAYDQGGADPTLSAARAAPYAPIADPAWVEKVMTDMLKTIPKKKLILGVPTYGYEYEIIPAIGSGTRFGLFSAFNPPYALKIAKEAGIIPSRNSAGEMSFIYTPSSAIHTEVNPGPIVTNNPPPVFGTTYSQLAIAGDLIVRKHLVTWSDAEAIAAKVQIARRLGLRGVAVFKFDGNEDQRIWNILK